MNDENIAKVKYALRRHAQTCREKFQQGWRLIHNPGMISNRLYVKFYGIFIILSTNISLSL